MELLARCSVLQLYLGPAHPASLVTQLFQKVLIHLSGSGLGSEEYHNHNFLHLIQPKQSDLQSLVPLKRNLILDTWSQWLLEERS
ncbi:unnamed protein product [Calypogeia fissa]